MDGQTYVKPTETVYENPFKQYKRKEFIEMRIYIPGEDLTNITVNKEDNPETDLGYIARNPKNYNEQWYITKKYAIANFDL